MQPDLRRNVLGAVAFLVLCPAVLTAQPATPSTLRLDRPKYRPGDCLRISVNDPDQNRDPRVVEAVQAVVGAYYPEGRASEDA